MSNDVSVKNKLRQKMQDFKDRIDEADEREHEAKEKLKLVEDATYQLESERNSKESKIVMAQQQLDEKNKQIRKLEKKLRELEDKRERENELVKTLEVMELDGDEKLSDLERQAKTMTDTIENKESQNQEMGLRLKQLESELDNVSINSLS